MSRLGTCAIWFVPLLLEEFPIPSSRGNLVWPFRVSQIGEVGICFHELITHLVQQGILIDLHSKDFCKDFHWFSPYGSGENV